MELPKASYTSFLSMPARWGLVLLLLGLAVSYLVLNHALLSQVHRSLLNRQLDSQVLIAVMLRDQVAEALNRGEDGASAFRRLGLTGMPRSSERDFSCTLVASDGSVVAWSEGGHFEDVRNVDRYRVQDSFSGETTSLADIMKVSQAQAGFLISPSGGRLDQTVANARIAVNGWCILTHHGMEQLEQATQLARLYLLVSFLVLSVLLLLLILSFYFSLAGGMSSAIRSAAAFEEAAVLFQENVGQMRRPLLNIQGLADMLNITDDPDERDRYLKEIKTEVQKLIADFDKSAS